MISSSSGACPRACDPCLEAAHVAVVVGAPDVDEELVAAGELVAVVGEVGQQVGRLAVGLHEDAVLVVAVVGAAQPDRAVGVEGGAVRAQVGERRLDGPGLDQAPLGEPRVELDPDAAEAGGQILLHARVAPLDRVGVVGHLRRPLADVLALVAILRQVGAGLAGGQRCREQLHLHAAVVEVVLPVGDVAAALEHVAERVAVGGPAAAARVERAGRVGRHELDVDPQASTEVGTGEARLPGGHHVREDLVQPGVVEVEVDEPRTGQLHPFHVGGQVRVEPRSQLLGHLARLASVGLGRGQRHVRGPVAVLAAARPLEVDLGGRLDAGRLEGGAHGGGEGVADHGRFRVVSGPGGPGRARPARAARRAW